MDIKIENKEDVTVVKLEGDIDATTAPQVQEKILPLAQPGSKILLDMTKVPYTSSAGLRLLLSLYRRITANDGQLVLAGLSEEIEDTMSITGFLDFFILSKDQKEGLEKLSGKQTPSASHQEKGKGSKAEL